LNKFMSFRDWVYLLSLLVPFVIYDLALKACAISSQPGAHGLARILDLMWSDVFFDLGYTLLWIGLFAAVRRKPLRLVVTFLFHVVTTLVVIATTVAYFYLLEYGTTLDYGTIAGWIHRFEEIQLILIYDVPTSALMLLAAALFYASLGPVIVTRAVERWRRSPEDESFSTVPAETSFLGSLGLWVLALGFGSLSLLTGDTTNAIAPFAGVIAAGIDEVTAEDNVRGAGQPTESPATHTSLAETPRTEKRNVVLIHLESARAQSVTPYNQDLKTTPFLDELAKSSLLAERAHVVVPRSAKATVAANCGIEPALYPGPEFGPDGIPAYCLAHLLKGQGYETVFFTSISNTMDNYWDAVKNLGYEEYYPSESMDEEGFQVTNTFGYEDDIMIEPSEEWLKEHKDEPFMAEYMTGTGHAGYECIPNRYGTQNFSDDDQLNLYLNCLRMLDHFLENLIDQYKELGLYEDTIFVIFGDHGEGFGEHGRFMHGDTIYEEGLAVPLLIHAPGWFEDGERVKGLSSQIDILPTVVEMLGYEVENGEYPGYSLLDSLPRGRTLMFSCISNRKCLASKKGDEKYIYHYGNQPDEVFDLSEDPLEKHDLARLYSKEELDERREDLLAWNSRVNAQHGDTLMSGTSYSGG
jgi:lipoteichoic acid synthase